MLMKICIRLGDKLFIEWKYDIGVKGQCEEETY